MHTSYYYINYYTSLRLDLYRKELIKNFVFIKNMNKTLSRFGTSIQRTINRHSKFQTSVSSRQLGTESQKEDKKDMEQIKSNPYFDKYKDKLKAVYE